jgi:hypothetical protein
MSTVLTSTPVALTLLFAAIIAAILVLGRLDRVVPKGSWAEGWIRRWSATLQAIVLLWGALAAVHRLYGGDTIMWRWLTLGVFVIAFWASRHALTDWATGLVLRSEGTLMAGGRIGYGSGRGRVRRLGLRSVELEAEDGRVLRVPHTTLASAAIEISSKEVGARSHTFPVRIPGPADAVALARRMVTEALLSPWSAAQPPPVVRLLDHGPSGVHFEVTVYPVDTAHASRIEGAVRAGVGAATEP